MAETVVKCSNGIFGTWHRSCPENCEWVESCKLLTESPNPDSAKRVRHAVDFEKNHFRAPAYDREPESRDDEAQPESEKAFSELASVLNYLVNLDDNTALAIIDILRDPSVSQAEIARKRGVSRQRINTSILHACCKHPELASLFCTCVKRFTLLRNRYASTGEKTGDDQTFLPGFEQ